MDSAFFNVLCRRTRLGTLMLERPFRFFYFIALDLHKQSYFLFKNAFNTTVVLAKMLLA